MPGAPALCFKMILPARRVLIGGTACGVGCRSLMSYLICVVPEGAEPRSRKVKVLIYFF